MSIDPKFSAANSATVSVAVTASELVALRAAAAQSGQTVSAWGAARIAAAMMTDKARARAAKVAGQLAEQPTERAGRASTILVREAHHDLKRRAAEMDLTVHAVVQAVLIDAMERELAALAPAARDAAMADAAQGRKTRARAAAPEPLCLVARVPEDALATLDPVRLAATLTALLEAAIVKTFEGAGPKMRAGMQRLAAKIPANDRMAVTLAVDPVLLKACSMVLQIEEPILLAALVTKALSA